MPPKRYGEIIRGNWWIPCDLTLATWKQLTINAASPGASVH